MLSFPDGTKIRVIGLDEILADLYSEGRQPNRETAEEIINRLEAKKNYIPSSDRARKEYSYVLLKEYRKYVAGRKEKNHKEWGSRIGLCAEEMTPLETCDALRPVTPSGIAAQLNVTRATMFKIWS